PPLYVSVTVGLLRPSNEAWYTMNERHSRTFPVYQFDQWITRGQRDAVPAIFRQHGPHPDILRLDVSEHFYNSHPRTRWCSERQKCHKVKLDLRKEIARFLPPARQPSIRIHARAVQKGMREIVID